MSHRRTKMPLGFVGFVDKGQIQTATTFCVNQPDDRKAADSRVDNLGIKRFQVYGIYEEQEGSFRFKRL